jgi:hypothetical protein
MDSTELQRPCLHASNARNAERESGSKLGHFDVYAQAMRSLSVFLVILAACGGSSSKTPDASQGHPDAPPDTSSVIDASPDVPVTPGDGLAGALATPDGTGLTLPIHHVTVTYVKPQIGSTTNDPAGFTVQAQASGPGLFVAVDPTTLNPVPMKGDLVDFTITTMGTVHMERRAQAIDTFTVVSSGNDVSALATDVSSATDFVSNITAYDARIVTVTGTLADSASSSGQGFQKFTLTTAGVTGDTNYQFRLASTLVDPLDMAATCTVHATNVPVGRFDTEAQIDIYSASDFTFSGCPAPAVASATALSATSIRVTFTRNLDMNSVMSDASQFTITGLTLSNPVVSGNTVTLTTTGQGAGTNYDVVVANTVTDRQGTALATTLDAPFTGFLVLAGVRINELNANIGSGCDLIELRVISDGTMSGFTIKERSGGSTELNFTFPAGFNVHKNDFIVLHENSGSATCNPGTATAETGAINDQPAAMYTGNYDTAFDFWATDTGLTATDNVIQLLDSTGMIVDAMLVASDPTATCTAATATETPTATVLAANQWQPPTSQVGTYLDGVFCTNAVDDLNATGTTAAGTSIQRLNDMDTDAKADWTTGAGAASTWGALNAGQTALP